MVRTGRRPEGNGNVAKREVEIDDADLPLTSLRKRYAEVGGEGGLAAAPLGAEDRDDPSVSTAVLGRSAARLFSYGATDRSGSTYRSCHGVQVALVDDFTYPRTKRVMENRGVHATPKQDDAERWPGDPQRLRQSQGGVEVDCRAEDDNVVAWIGVQVMT